MRCLQCGKELPLLKRLSGGEFCSDAHRLEYRNQFNDLALTRLMQNSPAKSMPPEGAEEDRGGIGGAQPPARGAEGANKPPASAAKASIQPPTPKSPLPASSPERLSPEAVKPDPARAEGISLSRFKPAIAEIPVTMVTPGFELLHRIHPVQPKWELQSTAGALSNGASVPILTLPVDTEISLAKSHVDTREFLRMAPVLTWKSQPAASLEQDASVDRDPGYCAAQAPADPPSIWFASALRFAPVEVDLEAFVELEREAAAAWKEPAPAEAPPTEIASVPLPDKTPIPLRFDALAPGRGRLEELFAGGVTAIPAVEVPFITPAPLRPVIVLKSMPQAAAAPSSDAGPKLTLLDKEKGPKDPEDLGLPKLRSKLKSRFSLNKIGGIFGAVLILAAASIHPAC